VTQVSTNESRFEACSWLYELPVFRVYVELENCVQDDATTARLLQVVGSQLRHQIWRSQCAAVRDGRACADRSVGDPLCECAPNHCLAHQLLPLSAETKKGGAAWLSPSMLVQPIQGRDGHPMLRVTIVGEFITSRQGAPGREAALLELVNVLTRLHYGPKLRDAQTTTFGRMAAQFRANRWRLMLLTPWIVQKSTMPTVSLAMRANGFRLSMAERVYKLTALALWSVRRTGSAAADGPDAHRLALGAKRCAVATLASVRLNDAEMFTEVVTAETRRKTATDKPREWHALSGWFELVAESDALNDAGVLIALATVDLIGIGEATSKGYGAVRVVPAPEPSFPLRVPNRL